MKTNVFDDIEELLERAVGMRVMSEPGWLHLVLTFRGLRADIAEVEHFIAAYEARQKENSTCH